MLHLARAFPPLIVGFTEYTAAECRVVSLCFRDNLQEMHSARELAKVSADDD